MRQQLRLLPVEFDTSDQVLNDLFRRIKSGEFAPSAVSPSRTKPEDYHPGIAKIALKQFADEEIRPDIEKALRHLLTHEILTFSDGPVTAPVPEGMTVRDLKALPEPLQSEEPCHQQTGTSARWRNLPVV